MLFIIIIITIVIIIQVIILASLIQWSGLSYNNKPYPAGGEFLGWLLALASMVMIPIFAILQYIYNSRGTTVLEVSVGYNLQISRCAFFAGFDGVHPQRIELSIFN